MFVGIGFERDDPFGGSGHRVVAEMHWRGAGVVGLACEREWHAGLSGDCTDDNERGCFALKDRALLYVDLEIGEGIARQGYRWKLFGFEAEVADSFHYAYAIFARAGESLFVEFADQSEAAEEWLVEADTFLFREADDFDGEGKMLAAKLFNAGDAGDNAEDAGECSGVRDGVQMGGAQQAREVGRGTGPETS